MKRRCSSQYRSWADHESFFFFSLALIRSQSWRSQGLDCMTGCQITDILYYRWTAPPGLQVSFHSGHAHSCSFSTESASVHFSRSSIQLRISYLQLLSPAWGSCIISNIQRRIRWRTLCKLRRSRCSWQLWPFQLRSIRSTVSSQNWFCGNIFFSSLWSLEQWVLIYFNPGLHFVDLYSHANHHLQWMRTQYIRMPDMLRRWYSHLLRIGKRKRKAYDRRGGKLARWRNLGISRKQSRSSRWQQSQASGRPCWVHHWFWQPGFLRYQQCGMSFWATTF